VPEWRYTVIAPSGQSPGGDLQARFDGRELRPFPAPLDGLASGVGQRVRLRLLVDSGPARAGGKEYFVLGRAMPGTGWQLAVFSDYLPVRRQAMAGAVFAVLLAGGLILLAVFIAQRRRLARVQGEARRLLEAANQALEQRVAERTADLVAVNSRLRQEIHERERAEQTLRAAQDELVQAAKLAVLGRMAAGITHELNQPLGAMHTLAANAVAYMQRGDTRTAENNLSIVGQQIDQMARIIGPLKSFARKSPAVAERVDLAQAVDKALFLFDKRLAGIQLDKQLPAAGAVAWCDGNRLQQVLVNLIGNALDALAASVQPCLRLRAHCVGAHVFLEVADNGPGLSAAALAHLFEPFFTTKGSGEGLGLGLTISRDIVRDFGGDLSGGNGPDGGALFTLRLPKAKEDS
jgi:two-component system C4-dicarboxylate transport sensor histidine kinase DctB